jgi:hypothetical protein
MANKDRKTASSAKLKPPGKLLQPGAGESLPGYAPFLEEVKALIRTAQGKAVTNFKAAQLAPQPRLVTGIVREPECPEAEPTENVVLADYASLLPEGKERIRSAQYAAWRAVNKEIVGLYWDLCDIIIIGGATNDRKTGRGPQPQAPRAGVIEAQHPRARTRGRVTSSVVELSARLFPSPPFLVWPIPPARLN